jgi:hypothetical protein
MTREKRKDEDDNTGNWESKLGSRTNQCWRGQSRILNRTAINQHDLL